MITLSKVAQNIVTLTPPKSLEQGNFPLLPLLRSY